MVTISFAEEVSTVMPLLCFFLHTHTGHLKMEEPNGSATWLSGEVPTATPLLILAFTHLQGESTGRVEELCSYLAAFTLSEKAGNATPIVFKTEWK